MDTFTVLLWTSEIIGIISLTIGLLTDFTANPERKKALISLGTLLVILSPVVAFVVGMFK